MSGDRVVVAVEGLEVFGRHGVYDAERELGQRFVIDLRLELGECPAVVSDRLEDTVDYAAVAADVEAIVAGPPVALLERLAGVIADRVLEEPLCEAVVVTIRKPHVAVPQALAATVVTLRRDRAV